MGRIRLFSRQEIWLPTRCGWLVLFAFAFVPVMWFWWKGEAYLAVTDPVSANVLVVEGWIGSDALQAAAEEFRNNGYDHVVATGGFTSGQWGGQRYSYAEIAARELRNGGVPADRILLVQAPAAEEQRTFASAFAVRKALILRGIAPRGINVFTRGMHARRSRLVNDKLHAVPVGVIAWVPDRDRQTAWWHSSERMKDLLIESCGFVFEAVLNSGRTSNSSESLALAPIAESPPERVRAE